MRVLAVSRCWWKGKWETATQQVIGWQMEGLIAGKMQVKREAL
jgi:hypothetical protein